MKDFFGLFGSDDDYDKDKDRKETSDDGTLQLRQEELDITKNKVNTGEVTLSKEIVEDQKTVDVPVTHEEVVIERREISSEPSDSPITSGETIRIPVSEEKVEVGKHTVVTGEISAHKREVKETEQVTETLKREEAHVNSSGDTDIVDEKTDPGFH
ncbi:YsnF/AvaK domain-containing protein [Clostridium magnum]|uniref:Stress response protein YsnF n=1 Tax=Clostridium magnum DSM 2767 TaxID=1121326 RepID=A0A162SIU4_9CLOT|nr:YsnF/AvaK domain-containing protein [Clostridium magnum]KZL91330.1 stress response protein YsnF [Clostridium magnum DSM 2767]SHH38164.1 conserved domain-containing protein [Clostridium magnum DSM 2767]